MTARTPNAIRQEQLAIRTQACTLATGCYEVGITPPLCELWQMVNFWERALTEGTEAMRDDYKPRSVNSKVKAFKVVDNASPLDTKP